MSNSKTIFVTLTPRQLFFFGGEQGQTADYFLRGSFIPQQTALLGLVRHQVLLQNELLEHGTIKDDEEAIKWIGAGSFEYNKTQSFGKIHSISPCYLVKKCTEGRIFKYLPYHQSYCSNIQHLGNNYYLPDFDPKGYYPDVWKPLDKSQTICNQDSIYSEVINPGVDKNYEGKTEDDDDAYYKQVWLKMRKGFAFGFYVTLEESVVLEDADVTFGKEGSPFFMKVSDPVNMPDEFEEEDNPTALMLISDAYVKEDIISEADFAITDTVPFRNIVSSTSGETNYYQIDKTGSETNNRKSAVRLLLLKKGSVFYAKNDRLNNIRKELDNHKSFRIIGYNHYHLLKINY